MEYNYQNLVFEGGGVKGIAYAGALSQLESLGLLSNVKRVAGTSAGAITATLMALGYSPIEIGNIIGKTDFNKFQDNTFLYIRDIIRLITKYGWNKGESFSKWIGELIKEKTGNSETTFGQLKSICPIELYVVCTNVSKQCAEIMSHETTPDLPIKDAIRMSMGIPIFFQSIKNASGDIIVDGGVTLNYPINIFDNAKYISNLANGVHINLLDEQEMFNHETIGFRVDSASEITLAKEDWQTQAVPVKNIKQFAGALLTFLMDMANKKHLNRNDWNRTIFIDSMDVKTTEFSLSKEKIVALIEKGKIGVNEYFRWKDNDLKASLFPKK